MVDRIKAVSALILRKDLRSVLMIQREHPPLEGKWSFVGGKVEEGESLEQAVRREIMEEIGFTVGKLIFNKTVEADKYVITNYLTVEEEQFASSEQVKWEWKTKNKLNALKEEDCTPGAKEIALEALESVKI